MSSDYIIVGGELYHYGVKGQKWGVRRYQNKDGTRTELGKNRYASATPEQKAFYNDMSKMTKKLFAQETYPSRGTDGDLIYSKADHAFDQVTEHLKTRPEIQKAIKDIKTACAKSSELREQRDKVSRDYIQYLSDCDDGKKVYSKIKALSMDNKRSELDKQYREQYYKKDMYKEIDIRKKAVSDILGPYANKKWCDSEEFGSIDAMSVNYTYGYLVDETIRYYTHH